MLIAIGSTNPVKINAVKQGLKKVFPNASYTAINVPSGVREQPLSDEEARRGAKNRAQIALEKCEADYGVGLEGGVTETEIGMMSNAWCAIINRHGIVSFGGSLNFHIPDQIAAAIRSGGELGPIMDIMTGQTNTKQYKGAVDIFTHGLLDRTQSYQRLVELATTKFVATEWFS